MGNQRDEGNDKQFLEAGMGVEAWQGGRINFVTNSRGSERLVSQLGPARGLKRRKPPADMWK